MLGKLVAVLTIAVLQTTVDCINSIQDNNSNTCSTTGVICSEDNAKILMCLKVGDQPRLIRDCATENLQCVKKDNTVTCNFDGQEQEPKFKCLANGEFPHPLDCRVSYVCQGGNVKPAKRCVCSAANQFILPVTGLPCVISDTCPRKAIKCQKEGQKGNLEPQDGPLYPYGYYCYENPFVSSYRSDGKPSPHFEQEIKQCTEIQA